MQYLEGNISLHNHLKVIKEFKPDLYAISFSTVATPFAYETINKVKEIFPDLIIIAGGPHPTVNPDSVFRHSKTDYCAVGEGEQTFLEFVEYIKGQRNREDIAGLVYKNKQGELLLNGKRKFVRGLADIPFPDWTLVDPTSYPGLTIRKRSPQGHLLISRGCPYNCIFCSNPVWKHDKPWLRLRSPESIVAEVKILYDQGIREIFLRADEMNPNLKWAKEVCRALKNLQLNDLFFTVNLRVDRIDAEFVDLLKAINCWLVHIGIESSSPRVLKGIRKTYTIDQVDYALDVFSQFNIKVYGYFMMFNFWEDGNGNLQYETPEEVDDTLKYIRTKARRSLLHYISWAFCTPYEGADLYQVALRHHLISGDRAEEAFQISTRLPGISPATMKKYRRKGMWLQLELALRNGNINFRDFKRGLHKLKYILTPNLLAKK